MPQVQKENAFSWHVSHARRFFPNWILKESSLCYRWRGQQISYLTLPNSFDYKIWFGVAFNFFHISVIQGWNFPSLFSALGWILFWEHFTESWSASSRNEVSEKYGWPMLKMSFSGFTAVQSFMQGLEISGGWSLETPACTWWPYENPVRSDLAVNHCSPLAHGLQSLSEIQMLSLLEACLVQNILLP